MLTEATFPRPLPADPFQFGVVGVWGCWDGNSTHQTPSLAAKGGEHVGSLPTVMKSFLKEALGFVFKKANIYLYYEESGKQGPLIVGRVC